MTADVCNFFLCTMKKKKECTISHRTRVISTSYQKKNKYSSEDAPKCKGEGKWKGNNWGWDLSISVCVAKWYLGAHGNAGYMRKTFSFNCIHYTFEIQAYVACVTCAFNWVVSCALRGIYRARNCVLVDEILRNTWLCQQTGVFVWHDAAMELCRSRLWLSLIFTRDISMFYV